MPEKVQQTECIIVGGGIAGLSAATILKENGVSTIVVDKGRGIGGRLATRRFPRDTPKEGVFDYGAQYFTVRDDRFRSRVSAWQKTGIVKNWSSGFRQAHSGLKNTGEAHYIGAGGIRSIAKQLAAGLEVFNSTRVIRITERDGCWRVICNTGRIITGNTLLLTPPIPQILDLLTTSGLSLDNDLHNDLHKVHYLPCIAVLALLESASAISRPGGVWCNTDSLRWVADNQMKGISQLPAVTILASSAYSRKNWEGDLQEIALDLLEKAESWLQAKVYHFQIHKWLYSEPVEPYGTAFAATSHQGLPLVMAGDGFLGGRVESAALSGIAAAEHIHNQTSRQ